MSNVVRKKINCVVEKIQGKKRTHRFIASMETPDRGGDVVETTGWELANYRKNNVVLYGHDPRQLPVGKAVNVYVDNERKALVADIRFVPKQIYPFAGVVNQMVKGGFIKGISPGFIPIDSEEIPEKDLPEHLKGSFFVRPKKFKKQELVELSIVPVPMHPDALINLNSLDLALLRKQAEFDIKQVHDDEDMEEDEEEDVEDEEEDEDEEEEKTGKHGKKKKKDEEEKSIFIIAIDGFKKELTDSLKLQTDAINKLSDVVKNLASLAEIVKDPPSSGNSPVEDKAEDFLRQIQHEIKSLNESFLEK